ncbi:hypothetical protein FQA39_LY05431 [Lamprigera yunnana]|nr:hypothetical protein FQA39_LY05431 [Lamprigera yunnana]
MVLSYQRNEDNEVTIGIDVDSSANENQDGVENVNFSDDSYADPDCDPSGQSSDSKVEQASIKSTKSGPDNSVSENVHGTTNKAPKKEKRKQGNLNERDIEDYLSMLEGGWLSEDGLDDQDSDDENRDADEVIRVLQEENDDDDDDDGGEEESSDVNFYLSVFRKGESMDRGVLCLIVEFGVGR